MKTRVIQDDPKPTEAGVPGDAAAAEPSPASGAEAGQSPGEQSPPVPDSNGGAG